VVAGVIAREPDLRALPASFNPRIPMLLHRCLQKDPRQRWHAVGSARAEMEAILSDPRGLVIEAELIPREPLWKRAVPLAAALIVGAVIAGAAAWTLRPKPDTPTTQFSFVLGPSQNFTSSSHQLIAISTDGDSFVYAAGGQLHLKKGSEFKSTAIQGSALPGGGPVDPSFSPDGRWVAFFAPGDKTIKRMPADGGTPVTVCKADVVTGLTWFADGTPNGTIVFGQSGKGISRVSADGGTPEMTITIEKNQEPRNPQVLPGGKTVLFALINGDKSSVVAQPLDAGGSRKTILEGASDARYAASAGRLVYALAGDVLSIAFNASKLETTGGSSPVAQSVYVGNKSGAAQFSFSDAGSMAYIAKSSTVQGIGSIALVDREGHITPTGIPPGNYETPRVSPNGKQLAFGADDGTGWNIWIYNLGDATSMRKLTVSADGQYPMWSGDGERVVFQTARVQYRKLFWQRADGTGPAEQIASLHRQHRPSSWAPHSSLFLYTAALPPDGHIGINATSVLDKKDTPYLDIPQYQGQGYFSPDGRWVVYQSNEGAKMDLYVQTYPKTNDKFQITREGGLYPVWSPDGKDVFFVNAGVLYSVAIQTKPSVTFANPVKLSVTGFVQDEALTGERNYDIMPDGKQFVMIFPATGKTEDTGPPPEIRGAFNWAAR
jgi:serine/threonine-protein kinase